MSSEYSAAISYLMEKLPMYSRIGAPAYKKDLGNIRILCKALGNPHLAYPTIHVAGTNGKGSTCAMVAAILQQAGYKTGLHTSPHLIDYRERSRIDGVLMEAPYVVEFVAAHRGLIEEIEPSFFEISVAMGFAYFRDKGVDVAVIETGLGGRLDSTNIVQPVLSIITNIGWDHMAMLGDTLPKIAFEKAGIIKRGVPAIIGETVLETRPVFEERAEELNVPLYFAEDELRIDLKAMTLLSQTMDVFAGNALILPQLLTDLAGTYQLKNLATVLLAVSELVDAGFLIEEQAIRNGLAHVQALTGFAGRWQVLGLAPLIIADTAHNANGWHYVAHQLAHTPHARLHMVIGMVNDKDAAALLALMPAEATYYWCRPNIPRGLDKELLQQAGVQAGRSGEAYASVAEALEAAKTASAPEDMIYVGGSTFVVAEVLAEYDSLG